MVLGQPEQELSMDELLYKSLRVTAYYDALDENFYVAYTNSSAAAELAVTLFGPESINALRDRAVTVYCYYQLADHRSVSPIVTVTAMELILPRWEEQLLLQGEEATAGTLQGINFFRWFLGNLYYRAGMTAAADSVQTVIKNSQRTLADGE